MPDNKPIESTNLRLHRILWVSFVLLCLAVREVVASVSRHIFLCRLDLF
jgi:hypothetical protein